MKKQYISPITLEQIINHSTVLCASNRVSSDIGLTGGDKSGDPTKAF